MFCRNNEDKIFVHRQTRKNDRPKMDQSTFKVYTGFSLRFLLQEQLY
jgi:hypothetical protein